jgi:hypothetical protein
MFQVWTFLVGSFHIDVAGTSDVGKSTGFDTALASGRGRTAMGENGRGVHRQGG